jgi:hypothetical protein
MIFSDVRTTHAHEGLGCRANWPAKRPAEFSAGIFSTAPGYTHCEQDDFAGDGHPVARRGSKSMENPMVIASNKTLVTLGLLVCTLGISSSADARKVRQGTQGTYVDRGYPNPTPGITAMPRNTPKANIVCWTPCGQPGAIVLGADPDPNIRASLLRDASGYFGGGGR